jgi:hypothetical protein
MRRRSVASKNFYIEHKLGEEYVEYEYEIDDDGYEPYVPAKISGPPENCYPEEGGYATADKGSVRRRLTDPAKSPWERVQYSVFLEGIVESEQFKDDPKEKPYHKTALQKAERFVEDELFEACEQERRDAYEDAMEQKADARRERDWDLGGDY